MWATHYCGKTYGNINEQGHGASATILSISCTLIDVYQLNFHIGPEMIITTTVSNNNAYAQMLLNRTPLL